MAKKPPKPPAPVADESQPVFIEEDVADPEAEVGVAPPVGSSATATSPCLEPTEQEVQVVARDGCLAVIGTASAASEPVSSAPPQAAPDPAPTPVPVADPIRQVVLEVPLLDVPNAYAPRNFRASIPAKEARTLRQLTDGLIAEGSRLPTGRPVRDHDDAIVYMLAQIGAPRA